MKKESEYEVSIKKQLYLSGPASLNEISHIQHKSLSLVTKTTMDMLKDGWIAEAGVAESSGGRKPILYQLQSNAGYLIVVAMDQFHTRIGITDLHNKAICKPILLEINLSEDNESLFKIENAIIAVIKRADVTQNKILGVGIAMPGFIDFINGINYTFLSSLGLNGLSIRDYLSNKLNLPVYIDNDSSAIALAEATFGNAKHVNNAMIVNISWGIGLGIIVNRKLYRGESGFAGEFSHIPLFNNGKICSCGKVGCLETETSLKVILEKSKMKIKEGRPTILTKILKPNDTLEQQFAQFIQAVDKRDMLAMELLNDAAYNIGRGIAVLIHIFNPKKIILSGRGVMAGNVWIPPIQQAINKHCIRRLSDNIELEISPLGHQAELLGAGALIIDNIWDNSKIFTGY